VNPQLWLHIYYQLNILRNENAFSEEFTKQFHYKWLKKCLLKLKWIVFMSNKHYYFVPYSLLSVAKKEKKQLGQKKYQNHLNLLTPW